MKRTIPIQFGIVPSIDSEAAAHQAMIVYHLLDAYGLSAVLSYLAEVCHILSFLKVSVTYSVLIVSPGQEGFSS